MVKNDGRVFNLFTSVVYDSLRSYTMVVYVHRFLTIAVNVNVRYSSYTATEIYRRIPFTITVYSTRKQAPFSDVIHWLRPFTVGGS